MRLPVTRLKKPLKDYDRKPLVRKKARDVTLNIATWEKLLSMKGSGQVRSCSAGIDLAVSLLEKFTNSIPVRFKNQAIKNKFILHCRRKGIEPSTLIARLIIDEVKYFSKREG